MIPRFIKLDLGMRIIIRRLAPCQRERMPFDRIDLSGDWINRRESNLQYPLRQLEWILPV